MGDRQLAGVGEPHAGMPPFEQRRPGLSLQERHVTRDGGLCIAERVRGARERATPRHLAQDAQSPHVEHNAKL